MRDICRPLAPWLYAFRCGELFGLLHCTVVAEEVGVDRVVGSAREVEESDCCWLCGDCKGGCNQLSNCAIAILGSNKGLDIKRFGEWINIG